MIRTKRKTPRPGRLRGKALDDLRFTRWLLDLGNCTNCGRATLITAPKEWDNSAHMAHVKGKRMWGDSIENVRTECGRCHREFHTFGPSRSKPCPPK